MWWAEKQALNPRFPRSCSSGPDPHGAASCVRLLPPWVTLALVQGELATLGGVGCANVVEVTELRPERAGGGASSWAGREVWMVHREDSLWGAGVKATLGLQGLETWLLTGPYSAPPPHPHAHSSSVSSSGFPGSCQRPRRWHLRGPPLPLSLAAQGTLLPCCSVSWLALWSLSEKAPHSGATPATTPPRSGGFVRWPGCPSVISQAAERCVCFPSTPAEGPPRMGRPWCQVEPKKGLWALRILTKLVSSSLSPLSSLSLSWHHRRSLLLLCGRCLCGVSLDPPG